MYTLAHTHTYLGEQPNQPIQSHICIPLELPSLIAANLNCPLAQQIVEGNRCVRASYLFLSPSLSHSLPIWGSVLLVRLMAMQIYGKDNYNIAIQTVAVVASCVACQDIPSIYMQYMGAMRRVIYMVHTTWY